MATDLPTTRVRVDEQIAELMDRLLPRQKHIIEPAQELHHNEPDADPREDTPHEPPRV